MNRKIVELMVVHKKDKKDEESSTKVLDRPMSGFRESEKVAGILNEIFPMVITAIIRHFNVAHILIVGDNSYDILGVVQEDGS